MHSPLRKNKKRLLGYHQKTQRGGRKLRSRFHSYASLKCALTRRCTRGITPTAPGRTFPKARPRDSFSPKTKFSGVSLFGGAPKMGTLSVHCGWYAIIGLVYANRNDLSRRSPAPHPTSGSGSATRRGPAAQAGRRPQTAKSPLHFRLSESEPKQKIKARPQTRKISGKTVWQDGLSLLFV